ncbi:MAG: MFS transporter [Candidatus Dormiibacterota bacterium]
MSAARQQEGGGTPWRVLAAVMFGTPLNPLNSSMIAVALDRLHLDFQADLLTVSWLVNGFYLAAAVGQPLMGRVADQFGPRRTFCAGLVVVCLTGAIAPFAPSFGWLVVVRVLQAMGTSTAYPAALAMIRATAGGRSPARALGVLSIAANTSAALGPVFGGVLVAFAGWQAIFVVNIPISIVGLLVSLRWLPRDPPRSAAHGWRATVRLVDPIGVALFSITITALLWFLVTAGTSPIWPLLVIPPVAALLLVWYEWRRATPFLDVRLLSRNRGLLAVYGQFVAVNFVFYGLFFGLPLWFEQSRGFAADRAGFLLLPVAATAVFVAPLAAWLVERWGTRLVLLIGSGFLVAGCALLPLLNSGTSVLAIVGIGLVEGIPNACNNIALQTAVYALAPPEATGVAGGLLQTARYLGAIIMTTTIGLVYGAAATDAGLHKLAILMLVVSLALVAVSAVAPGRGRRAPA